MHRSQSIYVAGHRGMVGAACVRALHQEGFSNVIVRTSDELDLRDQRSVDAFFDAEKPQCVILAAATVGGIHANSSRRAEFIYNNLAIESNVIHAAYRHGVRKLLFLGSTCIYPRDAPQPIPESALLSGPLEETNRSYAIAKIAGIELCAAYRTQYGCDFISAMPCNLYGPGDNYDTEQGHVLAAMVWRFADAKRNSDASVTCWGSGSPLREFLHVDDLAHACIFLLQNYSSEEPINVGSGEEISIEALANLVADRVDYHGEIKWDRSKPDGTPRKLADSSCLRALGWSPNIQLEHGIDDAIADFVGRQQK